MEHRCPGSGRNASGPLGRKHCQAVSACGSAVCHRADHRALLVVLPGALDTRHAAQGRVRSVRANRKTRSECRRIELYLHALPHPCIARTLSGRYQVTASLSPSRASRARCRLSFSTMHPSEASPISALSKCMAPTAAGIPHVHLAKRGNPAQIHVTPRANLLQQCPRRVRQRAHPVIICVRAR